MTNATYSGTRAPAGFTLLEMLVVLAILGLLSIIALPQLRLNEGARVREITHALIVDLRLTRDEAVRRGKMTAIVPTTNGYRLLPSGRGQILPQGMSIVLQPLPVQLISDNDGIVRFFPDGSATAASLLLRQGSLTIRLTVSGPDGGIQLHE
jgi:general secretion pathway protein H